MNQHLDPEEWPSIQFEGEFLPQSVIAISILINRDFTERTGDWIWRLPHCKEVWKDGDAEWCISSATEIIDHLLEHRAEVVEEVRERLGPHRFDGPTTVDEWLTALARIQALARSSPDGCRWIAGEPTQRAEETRRRIMAFLDRQAPPEILTKGSAEAAPSMRIFLLISNAAVALLFTAFFAYTFLGRQFIDGMAREFVTERTQKLVTPAVDAAETALRADITRRLLSKSQVAAVESEIAEFRSQPTDYIQRLTSAHAPPKPETFLAKTSEKIFGWKERIRAHYNKVLQRLFTDLRIFSGSNVVAAYIAFFCAWHSPGRPSLQLKLISGLLLLAIGLGVYLYIDDFSFFSILFDWYLGWSYPVLIGLLFITFYFDFTPKRNTNVG